MTLSSDNAEVPWNSIHGYNRYTFRNCCSFGCSGSFSQRHCWSSLLDAVALEKQARCSQRCAIAGGAAAWRAPAAVHPHRRANSAGASRVRCAPRTSSDSTVAILRSRFVQPENPFAWFAFELPEVLLGSKRGYLSWLWDGAACSAASSERGQAVMCALTRRHALTHADTPRLFAKSRHPKQQCENPDVDAIHNHSIF